MLWLAERERLRPHEIADALEHRSGPLALAGTSDMRQVEKRVAAGESDAELALNVFVHRLVTGIGAMVAPAGGLDVLAFTAGIGEHSPGVRARVAERLDLLGVRVDQVRNGSSTPDADLSVPGSAVRTLVITAREDLEIAREV